MPTPLDLVHDSPDKPSTLDPVRPAGGRAASRVESASPVEMHRESPVPDTDAPLHVVPAEDGWALRFEGIDTPAALLPTKAEAMTAARALVQQTGSSLVEHGADGQIR
jgi:hypothetical protein